MSSELQPNELIYPIVGQSIPIVYSAYDYWKTVAQQAFNEAEKLAAQIANIPMTPVAFNANFDPQLALTPFPTMPAPVVPPNLSYTPPALPSTPPTIQVPKVTVTPYVSQLIGALDTAVETMLGGNPMPPALAAQIRNRAYTEAFVEESRAVEQAYDEFAARGFFEPTGPLNKRVSAARIDARQKRQQINATVYIQEQTLIIDNLRQAVMLGTQLEAQNVEVWRVTTETDLETVRVQVEEAKLQVDLWRAQVEMYDAELRGSLANLDAATKVFQAEVEAYTANVQAANVAGQYDERRFQLNLAQEQAIVDTEMKRQDQQFEQMKYFTSVMLEIKKTLAAIQAQLASAAMSAVNIGASLSHASSEYLGYNLGINYSGQLTEASS